jgi:thiamine biosynthesis lipoprotein
LRPGSNSARRARPLLGTFVEITVAGAAPAAMHAAMEAAFGAVAKVHRLMSFHDGTSDVARLNGEACAHPVAVDPWTFQVLEAAVELNRRSAGAFDVGVAPVLEDIGLLPRAARRPAPAERSANAGEAATAGAIELAGGHRVRFRHAGVRIDLGGIAKGFAVDRAIDALRGHGMPAGLVNAGGDLAAFGPGSETVHLRDPRDPSRLLLRLAIENEALASSAHRFDPIRSARVSGSAVIDPHTRNPVAAISAATVRAPSCMLADALTKVVMVAGSSAAGVLEHYRASALVVFADGSVAITEDMRGAVCLAA